MLAARRAANNIREIKMNNQVNSVVEFLRSSWFLLAFAGGVIWWAAHQDSSLSAIEKSEARIASLENRATILETGISLLQLKIDSIKEDLTLIKSAVVSR
jgi:cell division protein FtsB